MKSNIGVLALLITLQATSLSVKAEKPDSTRRLHWAPFMVSVSTSAGHVFTPKSVRKFNVSLPSYQSIAASMLFTSNQNTLIDTLYGRPYFGIGLYKPFLHESTLLGNPISFYLIYGLTIVQINSKLAVDLEAKLGGSFGWNPYNANSNPYNRIIGSTSNYHAGADLFIKYEVSKTLRTGVGVTYTHSSDGAYRLPNSGLNTLGGFAFVAVAFKDRPKIIDKYLAAVNRKHRHWEYDLGISYSSRQILGNIENTSTTAIISHSFKQVDLSSYAMYVTSHYLRAGLGFHLIYDESNNITATRTLNKQENKYMYDFIPSTFEDRIKTGLFVKAEFPMGYVNGLVNFGYIFNYEPSNSDQFRINLGLKSYVYKSLNTSFGIQIVPYRRSNCVFFGLGYTINHQSLFRSTRRESY